MLLSPPATAERSPLAVFESPAPTKDESPLATLCVPATIAEAPPVLVVPTSLSKPAPMKP